MGFFKVVTINQCIWFLGFYSCGLILFMNGLLPRESPGSTNEIRASSTPYVRKIILMVVDGLRQDYLFSVDYAKYWKNLRAYMNHPAAACSVSVSQPPTVTLPRIKAITTGHAPKFFDIIRNLNADALTADSWVTDLKRQQRKLRFYGDETWLKLFPDTFSESDGTTSFFVNDYYEVDRNVTRHIDRLIQEQSKWDVVILHYLGLDHIGHKEGPSGVSVPRKLIEMDKVVQKLIGALLNSTHPHFPHSLFILTGDHGMSDQGGHGGSTASEKLTGLFILDSSSDAGRNGTKSCQRTLDKMEQTEQVDLATFIGLTTGSGIPKESLGVIPVSWLNQFWSSDNERMQIVLKSLTHFGVLSSCLHDLSKNAQLTSSSCLNWMDSERVSKYNILMKRIEKWLQCYRITVVEGGNKPFIDCEPTNLHKESESIIGHSVELLRNIQNDVLLSAERVDIMQMLFGGTLMWIVTLILCFKIFEHILLPLNVNRAPVAPERTETALPFYLDSPLPTSFSPHFVQLICGFGTICLIIHALGLASSSFAEEEHQLWYFFGCCQLMLICLLIVLGEVSDRVKWKLCGILSIILIADRLLLRRLHQTGNKWLHLKDISDWLNEPANEQVLWLIQCIAWITFLGLRWKALSLFNSSMKFKERFVYWSPLVTGLLYIICQLRYRIASSSSNNLLASYIARVMYIIIIFDAVGAYQSKLLRWRLTRTPATIASINNSHFWDTIVDPMSSLILLVCLLGRPTVSMLWIGIWCKCCLITQCVEVLFHHSGSDKTQPLWHLLPICSWLIYWNQGWISFFQQGNSLSLSTIDVSAAYVGLNSHQPLIAGPLLAFYTYAGPVIWQLIYLFRFAIPNESVLTERFSCIVLGFVILPITFCATFCFFLREHLFIWTVFTPKMFYCAAFYFSLAPILCCWCVFAS